MKVGAESKKGKGAGRDGGGVGRARYAVTEPPVPTVADEPAPSWRPARRVVSATAAARGFSELISRVRYSGETYVIEKGGRAMCELGPVSSDRLTGAEFRVLLGRLPKVDEEYLAAVEDIARTPSGIEPSPWER